jgi:hypothetical protein
MLALFGAGDWDFYPAGYNRSTSVHDLRFLCKWPTC